jgi:superfamily II DNA or RNA helicase
MTPSVASQFKPGALVKVRGREWVVLPEQRPDVMRLRPLGGSEDDATVIYLPLEREPPVAATFAPPDPTKPGSQETALLLRDALRLKLRAGAGPFRSFGNIAIEPRAYQLVPLLMALKQDTIRLLIADDVGIGKTIEAGLILRELLDRGEVQRATVICPPHLADQWQDELANRFHITAEIVRPATAGRLERQLRADESIFDAYPFTVVSLDYIKSERRRDEFLRACPEFVIVDEAHTCVHANTDARHQRYRLVKALAESNRHIVFLTATPHSGDDAAFHNLLGLLAPHFARLADIPDGEERRRLREDLANYFVQRRRGDIAEWKDSVGFPSRDRGETTYKIAGEWGKLFHEVLDYARGLVQGASDRGIVEQRMSWWAALALLRCVSSSPAAAAIALATRLRAAVGTTQEAQLTELDQIGQETVLDGEGDALPFDDGTPAGTTETPAEVRALQDLIERAKRLRGPKRDPKIAAAITAVRQLLAARFKPVIFCRYIATAHYVAEHLQDAVPDAHVEVVTGELTPGQRAERVDALYSLDDKPPVLVATDCLSEGINLQRFFDAVVHYDLAWNPTRHEQREGRVDRFGQASKTVRTLMIYGEDNPVDGAVLRVILRKADKIRRELGVAVPLPMDGNKVIEAIMHALLLKEGRATANDQMSFAFAETEAKVDAVWEAAANRVSRTIFAQRKLKPSDVLPEWKKAVSALGGEADVERFLRATVERLGAPLERHRNYQRLPVRHLPKPLQERLSNLGFNEHIKLGFTQPPPAGVEYIHRSHPLITTIADYLAEQALDADQPGLAARCSAMFTNAVKTRTTLLLTRIRYQIGMRSRHDEMKAATLLAEECVGILLSGREPARVLEDAEIVGLLSSTPARNMAAGQKTSLVARALEAVPDEALEHIAQQRAEVLLADHRRVREASNARGLQYSVVPALPVDLIGVYVFMPVAGS